MPVRVLIVDDHEVVRVGLRNLLTGYRADWRICGEAEDGKEGVAKALELAPDVVVIDLTMPRMNGIQAAIEIRRLLPATKIILFSAHQVRASVLNGAVDEFISKQAAAKELPAAIERLSREITPMAPSVGAARD
jgi:DNA-binding NarL/FixJ family response regulator